ncbi:MAG: hypothetical protein NTV01_02070, partial [Bacteroidia bacterium]|nr:hypothetical protein [Bacteroidia bacterium]
LPVGLSDPMFLDNDFLYFLTINSEIDNLRKLEDSQIIQELQKRLSNNIQQFKNSQNDNPYIVKVKIKRSKG